MTSHARKRIRPLLVVAVVCFLGVIAMMGWISIKTIEAEQARADQKAVSSQRTEQVQALANDVDALRAQLQANGEDPVAPPADETIESVPGPAGAVGQTGSQGIPGPTGSPGPAGLDGVNGVDGVDGIAVAGEDGSDGTDGAAGTDGVAGAPGPAGRDGRDGRGLSDITCVGTGSDSYWTLTFTDTTTSVVAGPCRLSSGAEATPAPPVANADTPE